MTYHSEKKLKAMHSYADGENQKERRFVSYLGEADFHDGNVGDVTISGDTASVIVRGFGGATYRIDFAGTASVFARRPHDIMLYSLSELSDAQPLRMFVFTNNEDDDDATLEIRATEFSVTRV